MEPAASLGRPAAMPTNRRAHVLVSSLLLALATLVVGCSGSSITIPGAVGPLLTVQSRGGECFAAPCGSTVVVERDGSVHSAAKPPNALGQVPPEKLAALDAAIKATDFAVLMSHPFTGECPVNVDGQEFVFEFGAPSGPQRVATCEVEVDYGSPLFVAVGGAIAEFVPIPLT
jgi:hypothetical protein